MLNLYRLRKNVVLILWPCVGAMVYFGGLIMHGIVGGVGFLMLFILLGYFLGHFMLSNAFSGALEGQGLLVIDTSSKGAMSTFLVQLKNGNLVNGNKVTTHFNRGIVQALTPPILPKPTSWKDKFFFWRPKEPVTPAYSPTKEETTKDEITKSGVTKLEDGSYRIELTNSDYHNSKMAIDHLPVIFCNTQTGLFLTKDFLAKFETQTTILHSLVDLYHKLERLEHYMLDFSRYVVQAATGENPAWWKNSKVIIVIIVLGLAGLIYYMWPTLAAAFGGLGGKTSAAFDSASNALGGALP